MKTVGTGLKVFGIASKITGVAVVGGAKMLASGLKNLPGSLISGSLGGSITKVVAGGIWKGIKAIGKKLWKGIKKLALKVASFFSGMFTVGKGFVNKVSYYAK